MSKEPDSPPLASKVNKGLLVGNGVPSYGSVSDTSIGLHTLEDNIMSTGVKSHRLITANSVSLPPVKWHKRLYIPGLITSRPSPFSNSVKTTKYTILNFLFKNLFEQFHRWANIYFLFIALLNFIPAVQAVGKEVGFLPLLFVLSVTFIKDGFEDYRRFKSDREVNNRLCQVYDRQSKVFVLKQWCRVRVGDFVRLLSDDVIPADLLFLQTSDPGNICYIQTSNIDGETNLKQRQVPGGSFSSPAQRRMDPATGLELEQEFDPSQLFTGELYCEQPHHKIHEINGYIKTTDNGVTGVSRSNFLLRGCVLRNTASVVGVVVYAGHETKAMLNNSGPRAKRSKLERTINTGIIFQIAILVVLCLIGAIVNGLWTDRFLNLNATYFPFTSEDINTALEGFTRFWTFVILYQVIIPLSLYVTIEIVKFIQIYFINWDRDMYYAPLDIPFQCRALNISEDLGQIQYVFSDKTGTLTENQMVFKCCSVGGVNYPHSLEEELTKVRMSMECMDSIEVMDENEVDYPKSQGDKITLDSKLSAKLSDPTDPTVKDFFITMAICNTVVVSSSPHTADLQTKKSEKGKERVISKDQLRQFKYEAESPDEAALVEAARAYGYTLLSRSPRECTLVTPEGVVIEYDILHMLEFDSDRKCMSVVVRQKGHEEIILYSKGADSVIYKNLDNSVVDISDKPSSVVDKAGVGGVVDKVGAGGVVDISGITDEAGAVGAGGVVDKAGAGGVVDKAGAGGVACDVRDMVDVTGVGNVVDMAGVGSVMSTTLMKDRTHCDLNDYAKLGLRTLCMAKRVLTIEEYSEWLEEQHMAEVALENRDGLLFQSARSIERRLQLLGATGIEDKLQAGVPEAIASLQEAGMKVWVVTGDKQETAINIGYSSHLINPNMEVIILNAYTQDECKSELVNILQKMGAQVKDLADSEESSATCIDLIRSKLLRKLPLIWMKKCDEDGNDTPRTLVIDGATLHYALSPALRTKLSQLVSRCQSVICSRVTPLQKAKVVEMVKCDMGQMVLAIGDGANDVSMIQKADVGVGIAGREGMQAVMASDFSMARFHFLIKLLLVHGHWSYGRLARLVLYFFYKNVAYATVIFWFQIYSVFSGSNPIDSVNLFLFNFAFTSLPIMVVSVADKDLKSGALLKEKVFYQQGRCSKVYNHWLFCLAMLDGFYQSGVVFFIAYGAYYLSDVGVSEFGFLINTSIVIVVSIHLAIETLHWTVVNHVILWGSVIFVFVFNYIYCAIDTKQPMMDPYFVLQMASLRVEFWFVLILTAVVALLPRMLVKVIVQETCPSPVMAARARTKMVVPVAPLHLDDTHETATRS